MDVHEYLGVLRRGVVFIVLGVVLGLLGGRGCAVDGGSQLRGRPRGTW